MMLNDVRLCPDRAITIWHLWMQFCFYNFTWFSLQVMHNAISSKSFSELKLYLLWLILCACICAYIWWKISSKHGTKQKVQIVKIMVKIWVADRQFAFMNPIQPSMWKLELYAYLYIERNIPWLFILTLNTLGQGSPYDLYLTVDAGAPVLFFLNFGISCCLLTCRFGAALFSNWGLSIFFRILSLDGSIEVH